MPKIPTKILTAMGSYSDRTISGIDILGEEDAGAGPIERNNSNGDIDNNLTLSLPATPKITNTSGISSSSGNANTSKGHKLFDMLMASQQNSNSNSTQKVQ